MPPTYPYDPRAASVEDLLARPAVIARRLTELTAKHFVSEWMFERGTPDQVRGGSAVFQKSESIYMDRDVELVGVRGAFPRAGWSEAVYQAFVRQYGLEVPINDLQVRREAMDTMRRGIRKLANNMVRFVDTLAIGTLLADPEVLTESGSDWTAAAAGVIVTDVAMAIKNIRDLQEGYEPDTLIVHADQELDLLLDADIADRLPREVLTGPIQTGSPWPMLGLDRIIKTYQIPSGTALVLESKMVGTIADEEPVAMEGYTTYDPGQTGSEGEATQAAAPIFTKVYRDEIASDNVIRAARWPAVWVAEPGAACKITTV